MVDISKLNINQEELEGNDIPQLIFIPVRKAVELLWKDNPKIHNVGEVIQSIQKHGFQELPKYDAVLPGIKAGNGRIECLWLMEQSKNPEYDLPRGLAKDKSGKWVMPLLIGTDALSRELAVSYAIDSNNLVMAGDGFDYLDKSNLWDQEKYLDLLGELSQETMPISFDAKAMELLSEHLQAAEPSTGDDADPRFEEGENLRDEWGVELGQLWRMPTRSGEGEHRLICGECPIHRGDGKTPDWRTRENGFRRSTLRSRHREQKPIFELFSEIRKALGKHRR